MRAVPLVFLCFSALAADSHQQVVDAFTAMAEALSNSNPTAFMAGFDPAMPGYERLSADISATMREADIVSSIDFVSDEGNDASRDVQLDWFLQIQPKADLGQLVRRRQTIKCHLERRKGKWLVTALEPLSFFAPPRVAVLFHGFPGRRQRPG